MKYTNVNTVKVLISQNFEIILVSENVQKWKYFIIHFKKFIASKKQDFKKYFFIISKYYWKYFDVNLIFIFQKYPT